jgi:hypothetical protein
MSDPQRRTLVSRRKDLKWGNDARQGKGNSNWHGGKYFDDKGYVRARVPDHPFEVHGYVYEHRLVIEHAIGRYLEPWESCHHINEVKEDNRVSNLYLTTASEHSSIHREGHTHTMEHKDHMRKKMKGKRPAGFKGKSKKIPEMPNDNLTE